MREDKYVTPSKRWMWVRVGSAKRTSPSTVVAIKGKRVWGRVVGGATAPEAILALFGGWKFSNACLGP